MQSHWPRAAVSATIGHMLARVTLVAVASFALACAAAAASARPSTRPTIPPRPADAPGGAEFAGRIAAMPPARREAAILAELERGNVPDFLRTFKPIHTSITTPEGTRIDATYFVSPDYLSVGSDNDFLRMPMTPRTAQAAADAFGCALITRKMSNDIFAQAELRLDPKPLTVDREKVETFLRHHEMIEAQRREKSARLGLLVAGVKKDVVLSRRLSERPGRVAIFGWQFSDGRAIQPLSVVHGETYVDYSHGVRLVSGVMLVGGNTCNIKEIWGDGRWCGLVSDEGVIDPKYYGGGRAATRAVP
jgi:hypothetical protein